MENLKSLLKQHILTILAVLAIIAMFFPFVVVSSTAESVYYSGSSKVIASGFKCMEKSIFTTILIVGPAIIAIMNYVKPLEKYKGILAIAIPIICIISYIVVFIQMKSVLISAQNSFVEIKASAMPGWGGIIALISYIAMVIAGAVTYHDFTFDKAGLEKIKTSGLSFAQNVQEKASDIAQNVSSQINSDEKNINNSNVQNTVSNNKESSAPAVQTRPLTKTNLGRSEEILEMIRKLSAMKDAGILTEEEFTEKKQKLLEEI